VHENVFLNTAESFKKIKNLYNNFLNIIFYFIYLLRAALAVAQRYGEIKNEIKLEYPGFAVATQLRQTILKMFVQVSRISFANSHLWYKIYI